MRFLGPGEIFNEIGVFARRPNPATAIALEEAGIWLIPRHALEQILFSHPHTALQIMENMADRSIGAYTESVYDWKGKQWSVPLIVQAGQLFKIGSQILQLAVAGKYWADSPNNGPEGWGLRVQLTFLFPK